jgi:hypothetical protein
MEPHFNTIVTHETGSRDRTITTWRLVKFNKDEFYLSGQVLTEYGQLLSHIRITTTSPIRYREGRVLVTESNSRYHLLDPHPAEDKNSYLIIPERNSHA